MSEKAVYAAGALCWRLVDGRIHVLLIHRTQYGDVTIPKGKVDAGESLPQTAVRELKEETGLDVTLGVPLGVSRYALPSKRTKIVHYWAAEISDDAVRTSTFVPNDEVAALEWAPLKKARTRISYPDDIEILDAFQALVDAGVTSTFPLVVLRHAKARARSDWSDDDASRPLTKHGVEQAAELVETVRAFSPRKLVTSTATRCVTTIAPLAAATGIEPKRTDNLSQDAFENGTADIRKIVGKRLRSGKSAVLCTHGPVLGDLIREIALATATPLGSFVEDAAALETGSFSVVHISATNPASGIVTIETHDSRV